LFQSDGDTCNMITAAYGIFEHAQEPDGKKDYTLDPLSDPHVNW